MDDMSLAEGALAGLKVLDLTHHIAGPYCTRIMAGCGAEVIKIEPPNSGEGARRIGPFPEDIPHPEKSGMFLFLNARKKGITLNLKNPGGVKIFHELVKWADLVVESFSPRVMPSLGLSYEALEKINPSVVMVSISNFGQTGPYRDYKATEIVEYALSGLMYITGEPDREPLKSGTSQAQLRAGQEGFIASMGALCWREDTGKGQHVDVSIMDGCTGLLDLLMIRYSYGGEVLGRIGNPSVKNHPHGIFPCKDGWAAISSSHNWPGFAELMGRPELQDPKFATAEGRVRHQEELNAIMLPWLMGHTKEEIYHTAEEFEIAAGYVRTAEEVYNCAQLQGRGFFYDVTHPEAGTLTYPGAPFKLEESPWQKGRAPLLGEHNGEVYCGLLGYSKDDLVKLRKADVI